MSTIRVYESTSGDIWDLVREYATGEAYVRHTPNLASGGCVSQIPLNDFLHLQPHSPEHQALVAIIASTSAPARSGEVRGYIHDPKEAGGPYIAVVLHAGLKPTISVHKSYEDAERELKTQLAGLKETTISHKQREENGHRT